MAKSRPAPCHPDRVHYGKELCRPCYMRAWVAANPLYHPAKKIWDRYQLTQQQYGEMTSTGCEICGSRKNLVIDHNHRTGEIRGALCQNCNRALGLFQDDYSIVYTAAFYLAGDPRG